MTTKYLFQDGATTMTYRSEKWETLFSPIDEALFLSDGIDDISMLPAAAWQALPDSFDVLIYTTDPNFVPKTLELTTEPYIPLDLLENPILHVLPPEGTIPKNLVVTGLPKVSYRYKVDLKDPAKPLLPWSPMKENIPSSDEVTLPASNITSALNPYIIEVSVEQSDGITVTKEAEVVLYDTAPTLIVTRDRYNVNIQVGDAEDDDVQLQVFLNGKQIYPEADFTPLSPSPLVWNHTFSSHDLKIGEMNHIEARARDQFGMQSIVTYDFLGEYYGILFAECLPGDIEGDYYSTDLGEILKKLHLGVLIAGQTSLNHPVFVKNRTGNTIKNVAISVLESNLPDGVQIQFSASDTPFLPETPLIIPGELADGEKTTFFVRIVSAGHVATGGSFSIETNAGLL